MHMYVELFSESFTLYTDDIDSNHKIIIHIFHAKLNKAFHQWLNYTISDSCVNNDEHESHEANAENNKWTCLRDI